MSDNQTTSLALQLKAMEDENLQLKTDIAAMKNELAAAEKDNAILKDENNVLRNQQLLLKGINVGILDEIATPIRENEALQTEHHAPRPSAPQSMESTLLPTIPWTQVGVSDDGVPFNKEDPTACFITPTNSDGNTVIRAHPNVVNNVVTERRRRVGPHLHECILGRSHVRFPSPVPGQDDDC